MDTIGKVLETFSAKKGQKGLPRPQVPLLNVIYKFGIQHDKFAGKDEEKAVMVVGKNAYELALSQGIDLKYGSLGENLLLDFNPHDYCVGTIFQIGTCVLEITQHCTICNHLNVFDKNLPMLLKECRGLYCKVLKSGTIYKSMRVNHIKDTLLNERIA